MDEFVKRIAQVLERAREESGLSQAELARRMHVSRTTVIKWEQGLNAISCPMVLNWFVCCGVAVERYIDACIHPGLLDHLEDDLTAAEKREILHEAIDECSAYEVDALLYLRYGDHGSDHIGVLTEVLANLHTPLRDRVAIVDAIIGHYEMAQATGTDADPNGLQPNMELLRQARDCGKAAAKQQKDVYSINQEAIMDAKKENKAR